MTRPSPCIPSPQTPHHLTTAHPPTDTHTHLEASDEVIEQSTLLLHNGAGLQEVNVLDLDSKA